MEKLDFFYVDKNYTDFLAQEEFKARGKVTIPFIDYGGRRTKFACGIIISSFSGFDYFVALSSYKIQRSENILIIDKNDIKQPVKGSLRFNYMIPVPRETLKRLEINEIQDTFYRSLVTKELHFVRSNEQAIRDKGNDIYKKITDNVLGRKLMENSCDFKFLEQKCLEYCKMKGYRI